MRILLVVFCSNNGLKLERLLLASSDKVELDIVAWNIVFPKQTSKLSKTKPKMKKKISTFFAKSCLFDIKSLIS